MASPSKREDQRSVFSLDPALDKERLEARIAHSIADQVPGVDEKEVEGAVREKYEELLAHAKVKQHVPTLTEGEVRAKFRAANWGTVSGEPVREDGKSPV